MESDLLVLMNAVFWPAYLMGVASGVAAYLIVRIWREW